MNLEKGHISTYAITTLTLAIGFYFLHKKKIDNLLIYYDLSMYITILALIIALFNYLTPRIGQNE